MICMREELRSEHRSPQFLCYIDLLNRCGENKEKLNVALNELYSERKIKVHKGLNDKLIEIVDDNRRVKGAKRREK